MNTAASRTKNTGQLMADRRHTSPIGLHHGSLAAEQRRKVEAAMARGDLRAVVCTSTLDLGIDWGAVDKVIPVDLRIKGCPPRPIELLKGLIALMEKATATP